MAARIFDDLGGSWLDNSEEFRRSFAPVYAQGGTSDYVARSLGFVIIDRFGPSVQVRFSAVRVSDRALTSAFDWLEHLVFDRLSVGVYTDRWSFKLCANLDQAKAHAAQIVRELRMGEPPALVMRALDAERLERGSAMEFLISDWKKVRASATGASALDMAHRHLGSRFVLTETTADASHLVFNTVGSGFDYYGPDWPRLVIGKPVDCQPDKHYARWVAETYEAALKSMQPILQDVDALITSGKGTRARLRIKRAVLPLIGSNGRKYVVGGSVYDDGIDLRQVRGGSKAEDTAAETRDIEIARSRLINSQRARAVRLTVPA